jgi:hypothetical protein
MEKTNKKPKMPEEIEKKLIGLLNDVVNMSDEKFKAIIGSTPGFHNYSLFNRMLVAIAGGSQVAGYNKWKELKNPVKKKEDHKVGAIGILAPKMCYKIYEGGSWKNTTRKKHKLFEGQKKSFPIGFFKVTVFDIQDTVNPESLNDIMTPKTENVTYTLAELTRVAEGMGYTVERRALEFALGGYISEKKIVLNSNKSEEANMGTLIHELAHGELGHTDTLKDHARDLKEQQAETVTYLVCQELGIPRNSQFYLKSWGLSKDILADFALIQSVSSRLANKLRNNTKAFLMED